MVGGVTTRGLSFYDIFYTDLNETNHFQRKEFTMMTKIKNWMETPWTWGTFCWLTLANVAASAIGYLLTMAWLGRETKQLEDKNKEVTEATKKSKWVTIQS